MSYVRPKQLAPVKIIAPAIDIDSERVYGVLKCPQNVLYKQWMSNSFSTSSAIFNIPPPSSNCITSREAILYLPVTFTITGYCPSGGYPINANYDCPRSFPIHNLIQSVSCTLNSQTLTNTPSEWISAMQHFNFDFVELNEMWSMTPTYPDQVSTYDSYSQGDIGSPFQVTGIEHSKPRGTFPICVRTNPVQGVGSGNQTATVDALFIEKIMLPPLEWGCKDEPGFANLNSMTISLNFLSGAAAGNRMWSHNNNNSTFAVPTFVSSYIGPDAANTGITVNFGNNIGLAGPTSFGNVGGNNPLLFLKYYQTAEPIPYNATFAYSYSEIQRYNTNQNNPPAYAKPTIPNVPLTSAPFNSSNIQLSSIPTKIYCYIRPSNTVLQNIGSGTVGTNNLVPNGCTLADSFCPITSINVQWGSRSGLLNSASMYQLYQLALKHGCTQSWSQWSGQPLYDSYNVANLANNVAYNVGGIVCFSLEDLGLDDPRIQAPGTIGQYNLQIQGNYINTIGNNISMDCYIVVISEGAFEITQNSSSISIAPLSEMDVMDAQSRPGFSYNRMKGVDRRGGSFLDSIKSVISGINDFFKEHKLVSRAVGLIPHPVAQAVSTAAEHFGYGQMDERMASGGVVLGGKKMSHKQLAKRIGY